LSSPAAELIHMHEDNKVLVCHRGPLLCAFNFHPQQSLPDYRVGTPAAADYRLVLDTDAPQYGGHDQLVAGQVHLCDGQPWDEREQSIQLYLPARTGLVLTRI